MGTLKPGATYIYETVDGVTYATEIGTNKKIPIGWSYNSKADLAKYQDLWPKVLKEAETNITLHQALERVILLYYLSKDPHGA